MECDEGVEVEFGSRPDILHHTTSHLDRKALTRSNTVDGVQALITSARGAASRAVNALQVHTNFEIGRLIVDHEQGGKERAAYGQELLTRLSAALNCQNA